VVGGEGEGGAELSLEAYLLHTTRNGCGITKLCSQCFGSGSALDPHSMGSWIRIQKSKISPKKEYKLSLKTGKI
jgi:hypothetical protein